MCFVKHDDSALFWIGPLQMCMILESRLDADLWKNLTTSMCAGPIFACLRHGSNTSGCVRITWVADKMEAGWGLHGYHLVSMQKKLQISNPANEQLGVEVHIHIEYY